MEFIHKLETNRDLDIFRLQSENRIWELGIKRMIFGYRVRLSRVGDFWCLIDYCCADDSELLVVTFAMVLLILNKIPEEVSDREISEIFPYSQFKPIDRDPIYAYLQKKAGGISSKYILCPQCGRAIYEGKKQVCCGISIIEGD